MMAKLSELIPELKNAKKKKERERERERIKKNSRKEKMEITTGVMHSHEKGQVQPRRRVSKASVLTLVDPRSSL